MLNGGGSNNGDRGSDSSGDCGSGSSGDRTRGKIIGCMSTWNNLKLHGRIVESADPNMPVGRFLETTEVVFYEEGDDGGWVCTIGGSVYRFHRGESARTLAIVPPVGVHSASTHSAQTHSASTHSAATPDQQSRPDPDILERGELVAKYGRI
jgi:hypothetical protein